MNNPINFVYSNLAYANTYAQDLLAIVKLYQRHYPEPPLEIHGKGTGLGLSISYQSVTEKHHGQLTCRSTLGEGTELVD